MKLSGFVSSASSEEFKDQLDTLNYTFSTNILTYGIVASRHIVFNDFLNWQIGAGFQRQNNEVYFSGNFIGSSKIKSWDTLINSGFEFKLIDELRLRLLATYSYRFSFTELSFRETTLNHRRSNLMIGAGVGYFFKN